MAMNSLVALNGKIFRVNIAGQGILRSDTPSSSATERGRKLSKLRVKAMEGPDDFKQNGAESSKSRKAVKKAGLKDLGYHPLEEIPSKNDRKVLASEIQLSSAAFARTIAETNEECIVFSSTVQADNSLLGASDSELFLELGDNSDLIRSFQEGQTCSILIGYGDVEDVSVSDVIGSFRENEEQAEEEEAEENSEDGENQQSLAEDGNDIDVIDIDMLKDQFGEDWKQILESMSPEGMGSLGAWGGPESLKWVHPWDFALKLSESVLSDPFGALYFPKKRLMITGVVRKASLEEERRIQNSWNEKYAADSDLEEEDGLLKGSEDSPLLSEAPLEGIHLSGSLAEGGVALEKVVTQEDVVQPANEKSFSATVLMGPGGLRYMEVQGLDSFLPLHSDGVPLEDSENLLGNEDIVELVGSYPEGSNVLQVEGTVAEDGTVTWQVTRLDGTPASLEDSDSLQSLQAFLEGQALKEGSIGFTISEEDGKVHGSGLASGEVTGEEEGAEGRVENVVEEEEEEEGEDGEETMLNTALYKVDILAVVLDSSNGIQEIVEVNDWYSSGPDMLAQSASTILQRANGLERARRCMADLVLREHSLAVEDAYMVGIDHLGIDVRVKMGIQLKTFRFPFLHPANSERAAERLLDELLRPRQGQVRRSSKPRRKKQSKRVRGRLNRP